MKKFKNRKGGEIYQQCLSGIEDFYAQVQRWSWSNSEFILPEKLQGEKTYEIIHKMFKFLGSSSFHVDLRMEPAGLPIR